MTTLYNCPKCGTAMEPPNVQLVPTRDELVDQLKRMTQERDDAMQLLDESRVALHQLIVDAQRRDSDGDFNMRKVVSIVSGICYPHNMPSLFATLSDGTLWVTTVVCNVASKSGGKESYTAKWRRVVNIVDKEANV